MADQAELPPLLGNMEGFGSEQLSSPFNYGSVNDYLMHNDSLEQKLRKKYWKTKQAMIQKFGKDQDEFVVAGDAEIDNKLENAYHLRSSCTDLLHSIDRYMARLKNVSRQESLMGEFLRTWSETEYTNAGEVMQKVGKLQESDGKNRQTIVSPLVRMSSEFRVFRDSAVRDLDLSIQRLEKCRMEYRAALLWMKDVSDKLHNPDYKDQLVRFREAQLTVKDAKRCFEKLKVDLGEKIDMVSASRCNLLSRSLPAYQQAMLSYIDTSACEFHQLLINLRTHHHHQYTVCKVLEEIRDLEAEEVPFAESLVAADDEFSSLALPEVKPFPPEDGDSDESLLDLCKDGGKNVGDITSPSGHEKPGATLPALQNDLKEPSDQASNGLKDNQRKKGVGDEHFQIRDPLAFQELGRPVKLNDIVLGGTMAELDLQKGELQSTATNSDLVSQEISKIPSASSSNRPEEDAQMGVAQTSTAADEEEGDIDDLLQLRDTREDYSFPASTADPSCSSGTTNTGQSGSEGQQDSLFDEWNNFSAFMSDTKDDVQNPLAGWEKEFSSTTAILPSCDALSPSKLQDLTSPSVERAGSSTPAALASSVASTSDPLQSNHWGSSNNVDALAQDNLIDENLNVDELLGFGNGSSTSEQMQVTSSSANELLSEELRALGLSPHPTELLASGVKVGSLLPPPLQPVTSAVYPGVGQQPMMFRSPLGMTQEPHVFSTRGGVGLVNIPPKPPIMQLRPGAIGLQLSGNKSGATVASRLVGHADKEDGKDKGKSWMNAFAHLDPLVNEKA